MGSEEKEIKADPKGAFIYLIIALLYVNAGLYAWKAVQPEQAALDPAFVRMATDAPTTSFSTAASLQCTPTPHVYIAQFAGDHQQLLNMTHFTQEYLRPVLERLSALFDLTTPRALSSSQAIFIPNLPWQPVLQSQENHLPYRFTITPEQGYTLGEVLLKHNVNIRAAAATVIVFVPPETWQPLSITKGGGAVSTWMQLSDQTALFLLNNKGKSRQQSNAYAAGRSAEEDEEMAVGLISWLLGDLRLTQSSSSSSKNGSLELKTAAAILARKCLAASVELAAGFYKSTHIVPGLSQSVAETAAEAAAAYNAAIAALNSDSDGQTFNALEHSKNAWKHAYELATTTDFGAEPEFPAEHKLAVLLPLSLPTILVMMQGLARHVGALKQIIKMNKKRKQS